MRFATVCSGIEAASAAWQTHGWQPVFFSEIEPFPCAVLAHHHPNVPNRGDMTQFEDWPDADVDVLAGGTPCQSFSVAGLRAGLADPRGNLMLTYLAIARRYRPRWVVWENVPGVLSSNGGRDFGAFLRGLGECGYGFAYRVLDAQYTRTRRFPRAVPQRRRRVFVVGYLGDWRPAAAVLFDAESLRGNPAPRREAVQRPAPTIAARTRGGGGLGTDFDCEGGLIASTGDVAHCLNAGAMGRQDYESETMVAHAIQERAVSENTDAGPQGKGWQAEHAYTLEARNKVQAVAHALRGEGFDASEDGTERGTPLAPVVTDTLTSNGDAHSGFRDEKGLVPIAQPFTLMERGRNGEPSLEYRQDGTANAILTPNGGRGGLGVGAVAFAQNQRGELRTSEISPQLTTGGGKPGEGYPAVMTPWAVRRLTPVECERLMGFPDDFTAIPYRNKPADKCPDGPRYKALGNSWAVNCADWLAERIEHVEAILASEAA